MFKLWGKIIKDGRLIRDEVYAEAGPDTRTHKVRKGLSAFCLSFDLEEPIWLDAQIRDFQRHARCRFTQDSFIEEIPFDYLEIQVLEEDDPSL